MAMSTPTYVVSLLALVGLSASSGFRAASDVSAQCFDKALQETANAPMNPEALKQSVAACRERNGFGNFVLNGFQMK